MNINHKVYDVLKWIAMVALPAVGTLYFALAGIWGLPSAQEVVGTITAIDAFLGTLLQISSATYSGDGTLKIDTSDPEKDTYHLDVTTPLEMLPQKKVVLLKVATDDKK